MGSRLILRICIWYNVIRITCREGTHLASRFSKSIQSKFLSCMHLKKLKTNCRLCMCCDQFPTDSGILHKWRNWEWLLGAKFKVQIDVTWTKRASNGVDNLLQLVSNWSGANCIHVHDLLSMSIPWPQLSPPPVEVYYRFAILGVC